MTHNLSNLSGFCKNIAENIQDEIDDKYDSLTIKNIFDRIFSRYDWINVQT